MASFKRKFEPTGSFRCERCGFTSLVYSFSKSCPFSSGLVFSEDCFIGRDPFSEKHKPLVLGSRCAACHRAICVSQDCSIFYTRRYCKDCFDNNRSRFPLELQKELQQ
ncbi:PREDICTED: cysteine-rich DPF motif domain-containing protein 1-like [Amphimedon queenslandica]|uniref:Cysteine-rich DPF motif domain-containing protein 1 n=1 Tax=Amphimedon queenslandica TaxID=400682 RepID=A0A1X7VUJ8_AMPQE|nr:PREDICTED: cysteine-rich DPF motif domain-containing protein 1-like [Amphimedon queenslandica]|eukprot:XP_019848845.1 PREDICTED: cysteine-rich DPF motif domain-containing protein 1-like [Amphimedon queenslandica]